MNTKPTRTGEDEDIFGASDFARSLDDDATDELDFKAADTVLDSRNKLQEVLKLKGLRAVNQVDTSTVRVRADRGTELWKKLHDASIGKDEIRTNAAVMNVRRIPNGNIEALAGFLANAALAGKTDLKLTMTDETLDQLSSGQLTIVYSLLEKYHGIIEPSICRDIAKRVRELRDQKIEAVTVGEEPKTRAATQTPPRRPEAVHREASQSKPRVDSRYQIDTGAKLSNDSLPGNDDPRVDGLTDAEKYKMKNPVQKVTNGIAKVSGWLGRRLRLSK